jgi:AraC family transcriptional regulator, regulatory protein of adaptative response / methylated-DNA-[protein]-cysteine methyltransferase
MSEQNIDYERVATAIDFLTTHFKEQPTLEAVAQQVHVSPQHFQRIFTEWSGVSPKKFVQFLSVDYLRERIFNTSNLHEAADMVGLSAQSRVYDLFVNIEAVTPQEYKTLGKGLLIEYGTHSTPFGDCLVATTSRGICHLAFVDEQTKAASLSAFQQRWALATIQPNQAATAPVVQQIFGRRDAANRLPLLLKGTNFQLKVWEALLNIPQGAVTTYQHIAQAVGAPAAVRAVGTAIGQNPVGYLIPCHRVIRKAGQIGEYHWGTTRKKVILGYEMAFSNG